jgi:hypothetical protein
MGHCCHSKLLNNQRIDILDILLVSVNQDEMWIVSIWCFMDDLFIRKICASGAPRILVVVFGGVDCHTHF